MGLFLLYLSMLIVGYVIGTLLRKKNITHIKILGTLQTICIIFLLLVMGSRLGANDEVIKNLGSIGFTAFITVVFALLGSLIAMNLFRKAIGYGKKGRKQID